MYALGQRLCLPSNCHQIFTTGCLHAQCRFAQHGSRPRGIKTERSLLILVRRCMSSKTWDGQLPRPPTLPRPHSYQPRKRPPEQHHAPHCHSISLEAAILYFHGSSDPLVQRLLDFRAALARRSTPGSGLITRIPEMNIARLRLLRLKPRSSRHLDRSS